MTEIEAKALAKNLREYLSPGLAGTRLRDMMVRSADYIEATEARHAAEMRELKERFSDLATKVKSALLKGDLSGAFDALTPFIIPAPDMVSEWLSECSDGRVSDHTMTMLRLFHHWLSEKETRKIGEAGND